MMDNGRCWLRLYECEGTFSMCVLSSQQSLKLNHHHHHIKEQGDWSEMYVCTYVRRCRLLLKEIEMHLHGETVKDSDLVVCTRTDKRSSSVIMPAVSGWVSASLPLLLGKRLLLFWDPPACSQPAAVPSIHQTNNKKKEKACYLA